MITKKYYPDIKNVPFKNTNETLSAIIQGMALKPDDDVLSICGSGDQPLAILEYVQSVTATDNNPKQIKYFQYRLNLLKKKLYDDFRLSSLDMQIRKTYYKLSPYKRANLLSDYTKNSAKYFTDKKLDKIRKKLDSLQIQEKDIFICDSSLKNYNKIYLSNAIGSASYSSIINFFDMININTLLYSSFRNELIDYLDMNITINDCFKEKTRLTSIAKKLEERDVGGWSPIIVEKIKT